MFCQPNFITNKIFTFLDALVDWSKKKSLLRKQLSFNASPIYFDTMEIYAKILLYFHVAEIVRIILI